MRERLKVSDLTTLFVCPSNKWGTIERRAIADSVYFRDIGGNSIIFCLKNSYVDFEAKLQDIPTIYYDGLKVNKIFDLSYLFNINKLLKENRFNLIHCYHLENVWSLSFLLMTKPNISLILTFNEFIHRKLEGIIRRWLFRRIDLLITFSKVTKEIAVENLPLNPRKIRISGVGVDISPNKDFVGNKEKVVGSFINKGGDYYKKIKTILYAIIPIIQEENLDCEFKFVFFSEDKWQDLKKMPKILELVNELGLEQVVIFETSHSRELSIQKLDYFVGTDFDEPFNDFEVMALICHKPVIIPRTASRRELLSDAKFIGESYLRGDSRELKDKILKILKNESVYLSEITNFVSGLEKIHGIDAYLYRLLSFYELSYVKRLRAMKKIESSKINFKMKL